jgi:hypothetical protein
MEIVIKKPEDIDLDMLKEIAVLVYSQGLLRISIEDLGRNIMNCEYIAYALESNKLIGTLSIKNPNTNYRDKTFERFGIKDSAIAFKYEIGYGAVLEEHRNQGIFTNMTEQLLEKVQDSSIYATTRDPKMVDLFTSKGFRDWIAPASVEDEQPTNPLRLLLKLSIT